MKTRSKFEATIVRSLQSRRIKFTYESMKLSYQTEHTYTPDIILSNGIVIEIKGFFKSPDRAKHLRVKAKYPDLDLRFVFMKASNTLSKASKTKYSDWCDKYSFKWAEGSIPEQWLLEKGKPMT